MIPSAPCLMRPSWLSDNCRWWWAAVVDECRACGVALERRHSFFVALFATALEDFRLGKHDRGAMLYHLRSLAQECALDQPATVRLLARVGITENEATRPLQDTGGYRVPDLAKQLHMSERQIMRAFHVDAGIGGLIPQSAVDRYIDRRIARGRRHA